MKIFIMNERHRKVFQVVFREAIYIVIHSASDFSHRVNAFFNHFLENKKQGGNGGLPGLRVPGSTIKIPGVRWESREYDGSPGSTTGVPGVQWKSREYDPSYKGFHKSLMTIL